MAPSGRIAPRENVYRASIATLAALADGGGLTASRALAQRWPTDEVSPVLLKAATTPATLAATGWAGALAATSVADFVSGLGPISAAAQLFKSALQLDIVGAGIIVPSIIPAADAAAFTEEGRPIRVAMLGVNGPTLTPRKISGIVVMTTEVARSSALEPIARQMLAESASLSLDGTLFSDNAATAAAPAGLLAGASSVTPASGVDAMTDDLSALAAAVAGVAGGQIVFVASPAEGVKIGLRSARALPWPVLVSSALASGTVVAIAANALAVAIDPQPEIQAGTEATLHMESVPLDLASGPAGSGVLATPSRSLFQSDTIGLRLILRASWVLRAPAADAVAVVEAVTW